MPLYEYRCLACGHRMEILRRFSDPPLKKCESCGGKVEKLISRSAFHLKGGGWYAEGYGASKSEPKSESKSESKADEGHDKKAAKPEKKKKASKSDSNR